MSVEEPVNKTKVYSSTTLRIRYVTRCCVTCAFDAVHLTYLT